jgi:hypothetical protein
MREGPQNDQKRSRDLKRPFNWDIQRAAPTASDMGWETENLSNFVILSHALRLEHGSSPIRQKK